MTKQIEGLVARARNEAAHWPAIGPVKLTATIEELCTALESTRSGVVDEAGLREILADEMRKKCGEPCPSANYLARGDFRFISVSGATLAEIALSAMRRVSKTDEVDKLDTAQDSIEAAVKKLCTQGTDCGWPLCGCDIQIFARDVMKAPAKTDEGRNAVSDEMVEAASKAYWEHGTDHNREWADAEHYGVADNCRAAIRAALEAANLCGRNAVIEECALICDERAKDRASFTGQETLAERELDYEAEAALHGAAKAIRALTTTGGK